MCMCTSAHTHTHINPYTQTLWYTRNNTYWVAWNPCKVECCPINILQLFCWPVSHDPLSSLAYPIIPLVTSNLSIKSLVARQWPINAHTHTLTDGWMDWAILVLSSDDTLVLRLSVDHCWVLLPALGLAWEQSHSSRASNCRGIDRGKAVINPGLLHTGHGHIPTVNGHVHPGTRPGIRFTDELAEAMGIKWLA